MKFKLYVGGLDWRPIIIEAQTYEDALSVSEDVFGDRVARLEQVDEVRDTAMDIGF